jgi:hypothetical protein
VVCAARVVGEDPGEVVDDLLAAAPGLRAAGQLGPQDVHPALQHPADVGEVGVFLFGLPAAAAHVVEVDRVDVGEEVLGEHEVDAASAALHGFGHQLSVAWRVSRRRAPDGGP